MEMARLYVSEEDQSCLVGIAQVVGMSMMVGIRIFSIVGDSGFEDGRCRGYGCWQLGGLDLRWPHKLKMPGVVWGRLRSS